MEYIVVFVLFLIIISYTFAQDLEDSMISKDAKQFVDDFFLMVVETQRNLENK